MNTKRQIIALFIFFFVLLSLCACSKREELSVSKETKLISGALEIEPPTDELLSRIEKDFRKHEKRNDGFDTRYYVENYYGYYNGAIPVKLIGKDLDYICIDIQESVAGYSFEYSGCSFVIWKNGKIYELKEAYEKGVMSEEDFGLFHQVYTEKALESDYGFRSYCYARRSLVKLYWIKRMGIETAYKAKNKKNLWLDLDQVSTSSGGLRCYGAFSGCTVLFVPGELDSEESKNIAGTTFSYSTSFALYGYRMGKLYFLDEAFSKHYIGAQEIQQAAIVHKAVELYLDTLK